MGLDFLLVVGVAIVAFVNADNGFPLVSERVANISLGVNVQVWGILGLVTSTPADRWTTPRICISLLQLVVGTLLMTRSSARRHGGARELLMAFPSFIVGGFAFHAAPPSGQWPVSAQVVFAMATSFAILSLIPLGRNFAVLPALRSITTVGPYAWIRHPVYVGEAAMVAACWLAGTGWIGGLICGLMVPLIVLRIVAEEDVLRTSSEYVEYSKSVRWRVIPGIW